MKEAKTRSDSKGMLDGGITVFLSLILTCICALLGGLYESARLAGGSWYLQMALNSSLDSLMSGYHRAVWEKYRLFLLEYEEEDNLRKETETLCRTYLQEASYYGLETENLFVLAAAGMLDESGIYLEQQILDYMKFGVWGMEEETETVSALLEGIREAESFHQIADSYQNHGNEILKLEKALDRLGECLKKQSELLQDGRQALDHGNGGAFFRLAKQLEKELKRVPGLIAAYEKDADRLREKLAASEEQAKLLREDLTAGTWGQAAEEVDQYRSYLEADGERRKEVEAVGIQAEKNLLIVEEAVQKAEEVQEIIDAWEADEEEDELDEEALWKRVTRVLQRFTEDTRFVTSKIKDKKALQVLETVSAWMGKDLLDLCMPEEREVSNTLLEDQDLPSKMALGSREKESMDFLLKHFYDRALVTEYTARYFTSFFEEKEEKDVFAYEQEYILFGFPSARENLKKMVHRLIAVREAANLLTLCSDSSLRREAEGLAIAITGGSLGPLTGVLTFFILTVWAFAESIEDVRLLLRGESLPFVKTAKEWKVSLSTLSESGLALFQTFEETEGEQSGLDYCAYGKLFLFLQDRVESRYRMLDLIQNNIRKEQPEFSLERCACRMEAEISCSGLFVPIRRSSVQEY